MFTKITDSFENRGNVRVKLSFFLEPGDARYEEHHVYVIDEACLVFQAGYPGEIDEIGSPIDSLDYDSWLDTCAHIWRDNPFHNHFLNVDSQKTDADIWALAEFHAPNFFKAWQENKTMRSGWAVSHRIKLTRYDEKETTAKYAKRKSECEQRAAELKVLDITSLVSKVEGKTFPATDIDVGPGAVDGGYAWSSNWTLIDKINPANDTGSIDTFEVWAATDLTGVKMGTFSGSGTEYTSRDSEAIGSVTSGSKQSFTGLSCDVTSGDFIGIYYATGTSEATQGSAGDCYYIAGDQFGTGAQTYASIDRYPSLYGTGDTEEAGWTGKFMGVTDPSKIMGVAVVDIAKVMGVE